MKVRLSCALIRLSLPFSQPAWHILGWASLLRGSVYKQLLWEGPLSLLSFHTPGFIECQWVGKHWLGSLPKAVQRHRKQVPGCLLLPTCWWLWVWGQSAELLPGTGTDKRWLVLKFQMNSTVGYKTLCHNHLKFVLLLVSPRKAFCASGVCVCMCMILFWYLFWETFREARNCKGLPCYALWGS